MNIYFDIETIPGASAELMATLISEADKEKAAIHAPANYKDEAKIADYIAAKHAEIDAGIEDKRRRTSFDGMFGSIACIAYAFDDGPVYSVDSRGYEKQMLQSFYSHVSAESRVIYAGGATEVRTVFVGHNIAAFDLPFLKHRSIILGVKPPAPFITAFSAKPWDGCIADTMLMWSTDRGKRVSMEKLCAALGIPGKGDFDGSMVADTWPNDPQKVIDYCKGDVARGRAIYRRLSFTFDEETPGAADMHILAARDSMKAAA